MADMGVLIRYNTRALSTGVSKGEDSGFVKQYKFRALSAGVISDDDRSVCSKI